MGGFEPTDYVESNILLAIIVNEPDIAREKLRELSERELREFQQIALDLSRICEEIRLERE